MRHGRERVGLAAYVYSLLPGGADTDDVLQEAKIVMWKQFGRFEAGTNFRAWARTIALHLVLNYRRSDEWDRQAEGLKFCLRKLPEAHRAIVVWRYYEDCDVEEIAGKSDRSVEAVYRLLSRIRKTLGECVRRQLAVPSAEGVR